MEHPFIVSATVRLNRNHPKDTNDYIYRLVEEIKLAIAIMISVNLTKEQTPLYTLSSP